jgi:glycosyltransferase involved in cell wall biosynthesis
LKLWKDWNNLTVVSPSQWLADEAKKSLLFKEKRIEVIANGHPLDIFYPEAKIKAKAKLGLPEHGFTILFGAANGNEARKGFAEMTAAINKLMEMDLFKQLHRQHELHALSIGTPNAELDALPIPVVSTGKLEDEDKMRWAYTAADVMLFPSLEENLSNMILEAMACGVVPIAFSVGGNIDIVEHNQNGMLVELGDVTLMADYVRSLAREGSQLGEFSRAAVQTVQQKFEQQQQTAKYLELYQDLVKDHPTTQTLVAGKTQVPMEYTLGPNLDAVFPELLAFTKKEFAEQIKKAEPGWQQKLGVVWRNSLPGRATAKLTRLVNGVK